MEEKNKPVQPQEQANARESVSGEAEEVREERKLSPAERLEAARFEKRVKARRLSMERSGTDKNYMSFIRRSSHPVFITEDKKDEYRSMHRLGRMKLILGAAVLLLVLAALAVFIVDNTLSKEEELPIGENSAVQVPVVLPRDDFEPVSYDPETGLAVYDDDFNLFLVNSENPLPQDYVISTEEYMGVQVDEKIVSALSLLVSDVKEAGMDISFERGYISYEGQLELYEKEVARLEKKGSTHLMAQHKAGENVDVPGSSDYHTGLSVKIKSGSDFERTKLYTWLLSHAADYGFILRYPEGKSTFSGGDDLTVLRYVGRTNALRMRQLSMCLEEYVDYLGSR